jgi:hypothetical protein
LARHVSWSLAKKALSHISVPKLDSCHRVRRLTW